MKVNTLAAIIAGLFIAGCGGGGDDSTTVNGAATPGASDTSNSTGSGATGTANTATPAGSGGAATGNSTQTGTTTTTTGSTTTTTGTTPGSGNVTVNVNTTQYLNQTSQAVQTETQKSRTVAQKSSNPDVKNFAQKIINEFTILNQQITQVSQTNNITINNNITNQQQTQINNINSLSGTALDRTYLQGIIDACDELLTQSLQQARQGSDVQVRQTATANLLSLEQRRASAQELLIVIEPTAYLTDAYEDGLLEIQLGQLALQKATNSQVKQFAQRMIDDHTQMNTQISTLAKQKGASLPTASPAVAQEIVTALASRSGVDFDRAYMDRNVLTHAEDVSKTTVESQRGTDADIRALADQAVPTLQQHLQLAQSIDAGLQGTALYQLGQGLVAEFQYARLVQLLATDAQLKAFAQQVITQDQAAYTRFLPLAQQKNLVVPLSVPPGQVERLLQLTGLSQAELDAELQALLTQQLSQSLQTAQALQGTADADVNTFAKLRLQILQSLPASGATTPSTTTSTGAATTTTAASTTTTPAATTSTAATTTTAGGTTSTAGTTTSTTATGATTTTLPSGGTTTTTVATGGAG